MTQSAEIPMLDHELAEDELAWTRQVYAEFAAARAAAPQADPKEVLREVLARPTLALEQPMELDGPGPWRNGRNRHGRFVAAVFLPKVELHTHDFSRTDQFPMYVRGGADGFSLDAAGKPMLTPVLGGDHFHNAPGEPHAFVPKVGLPTPPDWEIGFIAITPRNLREDTRAVSDAVRAAYKQVVGADAPRGV